MGSLAKRIGRLHDPERQFSRDIEEAIKNVQRPGRLRANHMQTHPPTGGAKRQKPAHKYICPKCSREQKLEDLLIIDGQGLTCNLCNQAMFI